LKEKLPVISADRNFLSYFDFIRKDRSSLQNGPKNERFWGRKKSYSI